jgi:hypothetical protein
MVSIACHVSANFSWNPSIFCELGDRCFLFTAACVNQCKSLRIPKVFLRIEFSPEGGINVPHNCVEVAQAVMDQAQITAGARLRIGEHGRRLHSASGLSIGTWFDSSTRLTAIFDKVTARR